MGKHFIQYFISRDGTFDTDENASKSPTATFMQLNYNSKTPIVLRSKKYKLNKSFALVPTYS